eukprot:tig00001490_g8970.t1
MSACEPVPPKSVSGAVRAEPTFCLPGTVPNGPKTGCIPCAKGSYENDGVCETCPHNHVSSMDGVTVCEACAAGSVAAADQQKCVPCGAGTFRPQNASDCIPVPPSAIALAGSATYDTCAIGSVPNGPKSECILCRPGSYQVNESCLPCALNSVATLPGSTSCEPCGEGFESAADGQKCSPCFGGFFRHDPMPECMAAPWGAVALPGSRNYTVCGPGTAPNSERTSCSPCRPGTIEINHQCQVCVGNTYAPGAGLAACLECAPGTVVEPDGQGCSPCPAGMFRSSNMSSCSECPVGHVSTRGSATCVLCDAGTEARIRKGTSCDLCRAGFFCVPPSPAAPCPDGFISAAGASSCLPCPRGYISNSDRTQCLECSSGTFQPNGTVRAPAPPHDNATHANTDGRVGGLMQNSCLPCKAGTWSPPATPDRCLECPPGSFPSGDSTKCIRCDSGTYMPNGTLQCVACPGSHHAPKEGTPFKCTECPPGFISTPDRRSCLPCAPGTFRPTGASLARCEQCPAGRVAQFEGSAACTLWCSLSEFDTAFEADEVLALPARSHRRIEDAVKTAVPGTFQRREFALCADRSVFPMREMPPVLAARPASCPIRLALAAPPARPAGSSPLAPSAAPEGYVSDELQTYCKLCEPGTFRNKSLSYCAPCPSGTFAPEAGATVCKECRDAQLCPLATSEPIDVSFFRDLIGRTAEDLVEMGSRTSSRRLLGAADADAAPWPATTAAQEESVDVDLLTEEVVYDTNAASVTKAEIKTEEVAKQRLYRTFAILAGGVGVATLLAGLLLMCYIHVGFALRSRSALYSYYNLIMKAKRIKRVSRLDLLYTEEISAAKTALACAPAPNDTEQSVAGSVATLIGAGAILLAASFVILQFSIANYETIQTLLPGTSPSASAISGPVEASASFLGWTAARSCVVRHQTDLNLSSLLGPSPNATQELEGVIVSWRSILHVDETQPPVAAAVYSASQRSCIVTWRCGNCRIASSAGSGQSSSSTSVAVDFRIVSRLAFAMAVRYSVKVPKYASISGVVMTHGSGERKPTVFRGTLPVTVPILLTALHFEHEADGPPRYEAALRQADNRLSERDEASFGLCSLTRRLSEPECAVESVGFRAAFEVNDAYLLVSRVIRASYLDTAADVAALVGGAFEAVGQLVVADRQGVLRPPTFLLSLLAPLLLSRPHLRSPVDTSLPQSHPAAPPRFPTPRFPLPCACVAPPWAPYASPLSIG